ncbi:hypothetical protein B0O99DRAFT_271601 [Bisporella sp. PMI_857]|nr:hypothetical protein B0O99DRAFT_271601 [Bisporella sp. PMI_857]
MIAIPFIAVITIVTSRHRNGSRVISGEYTPLVHGVSYSPDWPDRIDHCLPHPDNTERRNNWTSRLLRKFPFITEVIYWNMIYWPYQALRTLASAYINGSLARKIEIEQAAEQHALSIWQFEEKIPIAYELLIQTTVHDVGLPWVTIVLCYTYLLHTVGIVAFLAYGYTNFRHSKYCRIRRTLVLSVIFGSIISSSYHCTPPRYMPPAYGFLDPLGTLNPLPDSPVGSPTKKPKTLTKDPLTVPTEVPAMQPPKFAVNDPIADPIGDLPDLPGLSGNSTELRVTAIPSLHFGSSLLVGTSVFNSETHWYTRYLGLLYSLVVLLSVISNGSDWILGCFAGTGVVVTAWFANRLLLFFRPLEEILFHLLRTEKPVW